MTLRAAFISAFSLMLLRTAAFAQAPADSPILPDAEIRKILADRIGLENLGIGIVAGVIDAKGRRIVSYGSLAKDDKRPLNGDTIFELPKGGVRGRRKYLNNRIEQNQPTGKASDRAMVGLRASPRRW